MSGNKYVPLKNRAVIKITGSDREKFLQGIVSNDVRKINDYTAIYTLLLTPQGKFLYDFFISQREGAYFADVNLAKKDEIIKKLSMYKLRSDVQISDVSAEFEVVALLGDKVFAEITNPEMGKARKFCKGLVYIDPRTEKLFARSFIERENKYQSFISHEFVEGGEDEYNDLLKNTGVPSGDNDLVSGQSFPHKFEMDKWNSISYTKGCYVGQEVTTRVHHRKDQ